MAAAGYPASKDHQAKHQELRDTLENLVRDFEEEGATHLLAEAVDIAWEELDLRELKLSGGALYDTHYDSLDAARQLGLLSQLARRES